MLTPTASAMTVPSTAKTSSPSLLSQLTKSIRNVLNYPEIYGAVTGALVGYTFGNQESAHSHNALDGAIAGVAGAAATRLATPILDWQANRENRATLKTAITIYKTIITYAKTKSIDSVDNQQIEAIISTFTNEECDALLKEAAKKLGVPQKAFSNIVKDFSRNNLKKNYQSEKRKFDSEWNVHQSLQKMYRTAMAINAAHQLADIYQEKAFTSLSEKNKQDIVKKIKSFYKSGMIKATFFYSRLTGTRLLFFANNEKVQKQLEKEIKDVKTQEITTDQQISAYKKPGLLSIMVGYEEIPIDQHISAYRKSGLPFIMLTRGKNSGEVHLLNDAEINEQEKKLPRFSQPLLINEELTKLVETSQPIQPKHKREKTTQIKTEPILIPKKTSISYKVDIGPIAATQMAFANFPENAMQQVNKVIDDIEGGRITTKKVEGKYIYDIPLDKAQQGGRGAWRIAFETAITRDQETKEPITTFTLVGFIDYHGRGKPKFWGL